LRDYRGRLVRLVEHHRGRVASTSGDGVLAEFPSAIEAVRAAVDVQQDLGALSDALPAEQQMRFRIGINVGDVMVEHGDLFGEGVNVAARLQSLAAPGAILISGPVYDPVRSKLAIDYEFLGAQRVKNMAREIPVYRLRAGGQRPPPEDLSPARRTAPEAVTLDPGASRGRERALRGDLSALVMGGLGLVTGQAWMGIVAVVLLWLGLSYAAVALGRPWWQRAGLLCVLLVGMLAGINLVTGTEQLWFLYPAAPLLAFAALTGAGRFRHGRG
jgi:adenylate cyclase